jgi:MerR family transcriptional regulator, heat shock protein HspR
MATTNNPSEPLYPLKTAASRVGLSPRTLRLYEEAGLIAPARTGGNDQRLYSGQDLQWLRCIRDMIHGEKLTVPAIRRLLDLIPCWEIRHCSSEQAATCAPHLNIPRMAGSSSTEAAEIAATAPHAPGGAVELTLIYGVREFGAVLPCSRCTYAERILRKVAARYEDEVVVTKMDIESEEAARYGVLLPPAVLVDDELLASGQGVSELRLQQAVEHHLHKPG